MKFGIRTPSLKRRFTARTSLKRYVRHTIGIKAPRGFGIFTSPKKALYNRIYNRISVSVDKLFKARVSKSLTNKDNTNSALVNDQKMENKKFPDEDQMITKLVKVSVYSFDDEIDSEKSNMLRVINEAEVAASNSKNPRLFYWLAITLRNFTGWHVRGNERKEYLEKAIYYFDRSLEYSRDTLPIKLPPDEIGDSRFLDQIQIAGELGNILVNEAIVRDLDKAERPLKFVFDNTLYYEPCLCAYANLFYKKNDYEKCVEIALQIKDRIDKSPEWASSPPPAILGIIGSAYRALARQAKKNGKGYEAIKWLENIKDLNIASDNDLKLLEKLKIKI